MFILCVVVLFVGFLMGGWVLVKFPSKEENFQLFCLIYKLPKNNNNATQIMKPMSSPMNSYYYSFSFMALNYKAAHLFTCLRRLQFHYVV